MSSLGLATGHVRQGIRRKRTFTFNKGDLVLVKWTDGMVYFAKIKQIYHKREKCMVIFDDKSKDEADFSQIHSVDETTTDIICIKCKRDDSESPNEIVLCDMCGIGFHQKCHNPIIPASALQLNSPWNCSYCHRGAKCPFLTESLDVLQNLLSDDNESITSDDQVNGMESEGEDLLQNNSSCKSRVLRKLNVKHGTSQLRNLANDRRMSLRTMPTSPKESSLVIVERKASSSSHSEGPGTPNSKEDRSLSEDEDSGVLESLSSSRKRKKYSTLHQKRIKRSSVESHTVSVTRLDSPIFVGGSCDLTSPHNKEDTDKDSSLKVSQQGSKNENKSLRVSLSLPEEVEKRLSLKSPLKSPLSCIGSLALSLTSRTSYATEIDDVLIPDMVECKSAKQQHTPAPFVASPLPKLDCAITASSRLLTLADIGISEKPISTLAANNPVVVSSSKISAAQLLEKSVVIDEAICLPHLSGISSKTASPVIEDVVVEQPSTKTPLTDPSALTTTADSAMSLSVEQTSDAVNGSGLEEEMDTEIDDATSLSVEQTFDAVNGSGLEEEMDTEIDGGAFDGTTTPTTSAADDLTTSANSSESEVSVSTSSKEVCDTSCALLLPIITNPNSEAEAIGIKASKSTHYVPVADEEHCHTQQPAINRDTEEEETDLLQQKAPVSGVPSVTSPLPKSSGLGCGNEDVIVTLKPRPSKLFIKSPPPDTTLPTPVITNAHTHSMSNHPPVKECGQMTILDSVLASFGSSTFIENVGYSSKRDGTDNNVTGGLVSDGAIKDVTGDPSSSYPTSVMVTEMLISKAVVLAAKKTAQDALQAEKLANAGSTCIADPDVIITGVEPSKEATSRRDSALCRPNSRNLPPPPSPSSELSTGVSYGHPTRSTADAMCGPPAVPVAKCGNHQVQVTGTPVVDQRVGLKSPAHAVSAHNLYQSGCRVPLAAHCRSKSSTHPSPNGPPLYYTSVNPDVMTSLASKQGYTTNVTAAKPFAVVNAIPMSSSDASQKPGEGGGQQLIRVYNNGNGLSHVIPASMLQHYAYMLSPDATAGSDPMASLPNSMSAAAKKEEYARRKIRAEDIQSIQKKIGDAFNTFSETMLVSAFNEAWEKFQANAFRYKNNMEAWKNKALLLGVGNQSVDGKSPVQVVTTRAFNPTTTPVVDGISGMPPSASSTPYIPTSVLHAGSQKKQQQQQCILQPFPSNLPYPTLYGVPAASQQPHASTAERAYPSRSATIPPLNIQSEQTVVNKTPIITSKPPPGIVATKTPPGCLVTTKPSPGGIVTAKAPMLGLTKRHVADHQRVVNQNQVALPSSCSPLDEGYKQWQQQQKLASMPTSSNKPLSLFIKYKNKKPNKICARCGNNATFLCSGCRHEWYCGRDCQLRNWDQHADYCKA